MIRRIAVIFAVFVVSASAFVAPANRAAGEWKEWKKNAVETDENACLLNGRGIGTSTSLSNACL